MEDQAGNTHLFYRLYNQWSEEHFAGFTNSIYHLDVVSGEDNLFLNDYLHYDPTVGMNDFQKISDFEFWNSNPSEYIFCGSEGSVPGFGFIQRFDFFRISLELLI